MDIAVVGAASRALCLAAGLDAAAFPTLARASGRRWDLLALTRDAARTPYCGDVPARNLLLPGDSDPSFALCTGALQVVGYGFSPRDTLTLSCVTGAERLLCLQRSIITTLGTVIEPQELPLTGALGALEGEDALLAAGTLLLSSGAPL
ncbi:MAG: hypothetical protein IKN81_11460 [Oscillospiraceae bacterium]|nr:hypothetical protein [Oscillospiraceae bacterium]